MRRGLGRNVKGFTLIEILVVLFIISIVSSAALLSIGRNENRHIETFANELAQAMTLAEEQAMLQPTVLGLSLKEHSFQFSSFQLTAEAKKNVWTPLQDALLGQHTIPNDIQVDVEVSGNRAAAEDKTTPQIIISTNGDLTPFTIYIGKKGEKPRYAIRGDADGNVTNKLLS